MLLILDILYLAILALCFGVLFLEKDRPYVCYICEGLALFVMILFVIMRTQYLAVAH